MNTFLSVSLWFILVSAHFEPFSDLYLNVTEFTVKLSSDIDIIHRKLLHISHDLQLFEMHFPNIIRTFSGLPFTSAETFYHVIELPLPYLTAQKQCQNLPNDCTLASLPNSSTQRLLLELMSNYSIHEIHLNYFSNSVSSYILNNNKTIHRNSFINDKTIFTPYCPYPFHLFHGNCVYIKSSYSTGYTWPQASFHCRYRNSDLFEVYNNLTQLDLLVLSTEIKHSCVWIGRLHTKVYPNVKFCVPPNNSYLTIYYDIANDCFFTYKHDYKCAILCLKPSQMIQKDPGFLNGIDYLRHFAPYYTVTKASLSLFHPGYIRLDTQSRKLPSLCECSLLPSIQKISNSLQISILSHFQHTFASITQNFASIFSPIFQSKFKFFYQSNSTWKHFKIFNNSHSQQCLTQLRNLDITTSLLLPYVPKNHSLNNVYLWKNDKTFTIPSTTFLSLLNYTHLSFKLNKTYSNFNNFKNDFSPLPVLWPHNVIFMNYYNISQLLLYQTNILESKILLDTLKIVFNQMIFDVKSELDHFYDLSNMYLFQKAPNQKLFRLMLYYVYNQLPAHKSFLGDNTWNQLGNAHIDYSLALNVMTISLRFPIIDTRSTLQLLYIRRVPFQTNNTLVLPVFESSFIGIATDFSFAYFDFASLLSCSYKNYYLCSNVILQNNVTKSCAISYYLQDTPRIISECHFEPITEPYFTLANNTLYFYTPQTYFVNVTCTTSLDKFHKSYSLLHFGTIPFPSNCVLDSENFSYIYSTSFKNKYSSQKIQNKIQSQHNSQFFSTFTFLPIFIPFILFLIIIVFLLLLICISVISLL